MRPRARARRALTPAALLVQAALLVLDALLAWVAAPGRACASPSPDPARTLIAPRVELRPHHTVGLALELSACEYEEPIAMEQNGSMAGAAFSYQYLLPLSPSVFRAFIGRVEGRYAHGYLDYDGRLMTGQPYEIEDVANHVVEIRALAGGMRQVSSAILFTPYVGFGYRYLNDDASFDPAGYERESRYYYLPVGLEVSVEPRRSWALAAQLEYDLFLRGRQTTHLSDVDPAYEDFHNHQEGGSGARGSLSLGRRVGNLVVATGPVARYWHIDQSNPASWSGDYSQVVEPRNLTFELGWTLSMRAPVSGESGKRN